MPLRLPSPGSFDILDPAWRQVYVRTFPSILLLSLPYLWKLSKLVLPRAVKRVLVDTPASFLAPFLTLDELYPTPSGSHKKPTLPLYAVIVLSGGALVHSLCWLLVVGWRVIAEPASSSSSFSVAVLAASVILAIMWLYTAVLPLLQPRQTPHPSLVIFTAVQLVSNVLTFATALFRWSLLTPGSAHPALLDWKTATLTGMALALEMVMIGVALGLKLVQVPEAFLKENEEAKARGEPGSSREDMTTVWGWMSFHWVNELIEKGSSGYLKDEEVYTLSPTQRAAPAFRKFAAMPASSLLMQLIKTNGRDLFFDALLTTLGVIFIYASPFFIKRILDALSNPTPEKTSKAFVYAILAFLSTVTKSSLDLNHLWHSRRASVIVKSTLTSAIYDKALRRKDASGVADSKGGTAGTGKIVNLMAADANRVANSVSSLYMIYGSPLEIVVCVSFLYSLLGPSAFAGLGILLLAMPINHMLSKRSYAIQKVLLASRDKRLNIMNELIGAIKFIKFFAWERQWEKKVEDARNAELKIMVRDRMNSILFNLLWTLTPALVTVSSFFFFVQVQKGELSTATAFTALSLFTMLRGPLNLIPMFVVSLLQTHVAIIRIEDFLKEDEVPTFVSTLKMKEQAITSDPSTSGKLGFVGASFRWNQGTKTAEADKPKDTKAKDKKPEPIKNINGSSSRESSPTASDEPTVVEEAEEPRVFELSDLSFVFPPGAMTIVTGATGSGKTALLLALCGELTILKGNVLLPKDTAHFDKDGLTDSVAYAGQTAWLQNLSIKDNILFGSAFDQARYDAVIKAASLLPDLEMLEDGDATEIGSKGVSLSGGQKARVALARAVYSRAKNVLLDDPLSAVDAHTAASLVTDCLAGPLMEGRTVVLVTHHVEICLPFAHSLIRVLDGRVDISGSIEELRARGELSSIVAIEEASHPNEETVIPPTPSGSAGKEMSEEEAMNGAGDEDSKASTVKDGASEQTVEAPKKKEARRLVKDEERAVGNVGWATYKIYLEATTYTIWAIVLSLMLLAQNFVFVERWWVSVWTQSYSDTYHAPKPQSYDMHHELSTGYQDAQHSFSLASLSPASTSNGSFTVKGRPSADDHPLYYLSIYTLITLFSATLAITQSIVGFYGAWRASKTLHEQMLHSVIRSTPRWFDTTPAGRIVNRFSRDQETIDGALAQSLRVVATWSASLIGSIFMVTFVVPAFLLPAIFISWAYLRLSIAYIRVGRDLRRIEATARSPIFSGFGEVLEGIAVVRAFGVEQRFLENLQKQVDKSLAAFYFTWMTSRWLLLRFDCLGAVSVLFTSLLTIGSGVSGGAGGMAILAAQGFVSSCYWLCRFWSQLEMDLNSIERVAEYLELPQEPPAIIEGHRPPAYWPSSSGETLISVQDLVIAYSPELPPVLKGISFEIKPKEKIGLIGRTGSGKSTLGSALLRFADPISGQIVIDGIDVTKIGLDDLRSAVGLIPQDAVLFSGTIRDNLDPFNEHSDEELLDALHRVQLGTTGTSTAPSRVPSSTDLIKLGGEPDGEGAVKATSIISSGKIAITLDSEVSAGGANFSQGQRQLLALARSLLRNSSIIIMDEATASVDFETDTLIQQTIREEFKDSCVITIAHRLSSIIDFDRLIVLDHGHLIEFDTPYNLLQKDSGDEKAIFKSMCEKSGKFGELFEAAERKMKADQSA